ncbi:FecR family protein [Pedobacter sp. N36a]|uniref:FecR family protein n=1 Tax=Pedobacter sp. N36a TaxID=2767996 RepID=UPI001656F683|nr:FecR family protein [Pedobacter sp. N36a]MBC8985246.1 FecR family protein [Pedobacter sp. N36a]
MSVSEALLDKYFKGQCSPEEKLQVLNYLNAIDELPDHLLGQAEWDETNDAQLEELKSEEMFNAVKKQTLAKTYRLKWIKIVAAAAVLLAILSIGPFNLNWNPRDSKITLASNKALTPEKANPINWKSVVNYTDHQQLVNLPDGSTVKIFPGAELRYAIPFVKNKREVFLNGKSFFEVSKDTNHPFVVYAQGIATTALGTSFTITALEKSKFIKVELHTGKVLVKNIDTVQHISAFSEVLLPGKELVYNSILNKISVSDHRSLLAKGKNGSQDLNFQQASLVDVFDQFEKYYKVKITYDRADLAEMSFTGSIKPTQSIETILEEIAELNKLNQIKTAEGFLIRK